MCQKPGMFLRLSSARTSANARHMFLEPLGPSCLAMKSLTDGCVAMPAIAAPMAARPAIALRRIAADIVAGTSNRNVSEW